MSKRNLSPLPSSTSQQAAACFGRTLGIPVPSATTRISSDASTTEDGAYTIDEAGIAANSITRNPGAMVVLPNENEWYKAAYYDVGSAAYRAFPTDSDLPTDCKPPSGYLNLR